MARQATSRVQPRSRPSRKYAPPVSPSVDQMAAEIEAGFRQAAADAVQQAHARGQAVPVADETGQVAWLHPDGITRPTRDPVHTTRS